MDLFEQHDQNLQNLRSLALGLIYTGVGAALALVTGLIALAVLL